MRQATEEQMKMIDEALKADSTIGRINRDGYTIYFIHLLDGDGNMTGKVVTSVDYDNLAKYLAKEEA
jgi:hypothetical protein